MRSRAARLTFGAIAWLAIGSAAAFVVYAERQLARERTLERAFDLHAREATDALAELRAAQQAYVAVGQGVAFWMPKVAGIASSFSRTLVTLQSSATSADARASLEEAAASMNEFQAVDARAREYLAARQTLMAGDVIFTEGDQTVSTAARQIEAARLAEHRAIDASEAARRRVEAGAAGGAAVLAALILAFLVPGRSAESGDQKHPSAGLGLAGEAGELSLRDASHAASPAVPVARAVSPVLLGAAQLCTEFARVTTLEELRMLLERAADMMDANGIVVWLGTPGGSDLRPVLAHGYSAQTVARMATLSRSSDNAAAAAYRSGTLQIVLARPGSFSGAIVAPLLGPDGCIGAFAAEIMSGGEGSDAVQALAALFAAQLAAVLGTPAEAATAQRAAGTA